MGSWDVSDSELLVKLYTCDKLELLEICRIMKRKCKVIISKLIELQIVKSKYEIRGNDTTYKPINQTLNKSQKIEQVQNDTLVLLDGINKIITQAAVICSNYSKLVSSVKNIYNSNESK